SRRPAPHDPATAFLPGVNLVRMHLIALRQIGYCRLLPQRLQRNLRLQCRVDRLVFCVIPRSVCCDGTARNPISQLVRNPGSTSRRGKISVAAPTVAVAAEAIVDTYGNQIHVLVDPTDASYEGGRDQQ